MAAGKKAAADDAKDTMEASYDLDKAIKNANTHLRMRLSNGPKNWPRLRESFITEISNRVGTGEIESDLTGKALTAYINTELIQVAE